MESAFGQTPQANRARRRLHAGLPWQASVDARAGIWPNTAGKQSPPPTPCCDNITINSHEDLNVSASSKSIMKLFFIVIWFILIHLDNVSADHVRAQASTTLRPTFIVRNQKTA